MIGVLAGNYEVFRNFYLGAGFQKNQKKFIHIRDPMDCSGRRFDLLIYSCGWLGKLEEFERQGLRQMLWHTVPYPAYRYIRFFSCCGRRHPDTHLSRRPILMGPPDLSWLEEYRPLPSPPPLIYDKKYYIIPDIT